jgi:hypothetical protein
MFSTLRTPAAWRSYAMLFVLGLAMQLTACSKTVQWEEEVPLNTGETIWVNRSDSYVKGGEPGNPLQMTWGLNERRYEFAWHGQKYLYRTKTMVGGPVRIHAFVSENSIGIVDFVLSCGHPGLGELRWVQGRWQLQPNASSELIGQPRNLMGSFSADGGIPDRIDTKFKRQMDTAPNTFRQIMQITEDHLARNCHRPK